MRLGLLLIKLPLVNEPLHHSARDAPPPLADAIAEFGNSWRLQTARAVDGLGRNIVFRHDAGIFAHEVQLGYIFKEAGPGISLMTEFVGLGYFAEIPVVIIDVQRMGPSTGLPTRTSQGDVLKMHLLGHGDCRHIVLIPGSVEECYSLTIEALDLAQQFQTPVFVASDLDLGMNLWLSDPFPYPTKPIRRGKVLSAEDLERLGHFERYKDIDGDGVCYRTIPGTEHPLAAYFTRGTGHNEKSGYSERPEDWKKNLDRLARKLETARQALPDPVIDDVLGAKVGLL